MTYSQRLILEPCSTLNRCTKQKDLLAGRASLRIHNRTVWFRTTYNRQGCFKVWHLGEEFLFDACVQSLWVAAKRIFGSLLVESAHKRQWNCFSPLVLSFKSTESKFLGINRSQYASSCPHFCRRSCSNVRPYVRCMGDLWVPKGYLILYFCTFYPSKLFL